MYKRRWTQQWLGYSTILRAMILFRQMLCKRFELCVILSLAGVELTRHGVRSDRIEEVKTIKIRSYSFYRLKSYGIFNSQAPDSFNFHNPGQRPS